MRILYLTTLLLLSFFARAQYTEKIETDRPDQTETPFLVPKKYFQGEFGINREKYRDGVSQYVHPTSLLKYGLSNRIELRLEGTVLTTTKQLIPNPVTNTAFEPVEIGTKIRFWEEKGLRPKVSLITHLGLPFFAGRQFRSEPFGASFRLTLQNTLSEAVALGYNVGVVAGGGESPSYFYTFAPGFNLGPRWYGYLEAFGFIFQNYSEHNLDAGIAYYFSNNTKIDISSGFGLGNSLLKQYVAIGFSFRNLLGKKEQGQTN